MKSIREAVACARERILETYHDLHSMPEGPFEEVRTSAYIANRLRQAGYDVRTGVGKTGVVASGKTLADRGVIALRADMDALEHEVDGIRSHVHSCGHDAHSAMVLCAAEIIREICPEAEHRVRLLFQPAEEIGRGAVHMTEDGALEGVSTVVGIHVRPIAECRLGYATPHLAHAGGITLKYKVAGRPAHSARPHLGTNVADAVAAATVAVNSVKPNPMSCATVNVVRITAGDGPANVIPASGSMVVNIRAESDEIGKGLRDRVDRAVVGAAAAVGAQVTLEEENMMPAACCDPETVEMVGRAIVRVLGPEGLLPKVLTPGSEDFHFFPKLVPGLRSAYIGLGADFSPGLHDPGATFNQEALLLGTEILVETVREFLKPAPVHERNDS
ncbi:MAG: amidohydrolase [Firmicutes bacterium]|jgi:amidohydrolase|nr:amidohydrolase [Bacillota bacterium]